MIRLTPLRASRWLACAVAACLLARAEERPVAAVPLAEGLYAFSGTMSNSAALVGPDGVLLIDSGDAPAVAAQLQKALTGLTPKPVRLLVNTHWHFDHVNGNGFFAERGTVLIGQAAMRERASRQPGQAGAKPLSAAELPVVTFRDGLVLQFDGEEVELRHPKAGEGHTDGDTVVFFRHANVVHMGDLYFEGLYPYIDTDAGGWSEGIVAAIEEVLPMMNDATKVVPGHGPVSDKKKLAAYAAMLRDIGGRVAALVDQGKTLEQIRAAKPSAAYDAQWGVAWLKPDQFVELVYRGVVKHRSTRN